ncbi:YicC/YloC family endoribonuclease [Alkalicoccus daliensis]|uniref:TIGR00255 family protein n=1 Tax=Alkalicoccus daliensis TaxID=745820 RepID=A0A1G9ZXS5_9BACI|nr:YicC/YloC family endoribonuclease [Alkalicoccus daliensis]SDN26068.1 TIGR00255 family protein [Alkalicoccus daliensis]
MKNCLEYKVDVIAMLRSMTGFGRSAEKISSGRLTIEIKAVNHRFCEIKPRLPQQWAGLEESIISRCREYVHRGKLDVSFFLNEEEAKTKEVHIDWDLLLQFQQRFEEIKSFTGSKETFPAAAMLQNEDIVYISEPEQIVNKTKAELLPVLDEALKELSAMRKQEGSILYTDLRKRTELLESYTDKIHKLAPQVKEDYRAKLSEQVNDFMAGRKADENRLMTEIAVFSEKADISEEITRIKSHTEHLGLTFKSEGPVGRKLDFIIQELNREINTIGSKANSGELGKIVVEMKNELEKMREQVQNIE